MDLEKFCNTVEYMNLSQEENIMRNMILDKDIKNFCRELDVGFQVEFIKEYEKIGDSKLYGGKHCGSDAENEGSEFIAEKLKEIGLSNIQMLPCKTARYQFNSAEISVADEEKIIYPYGYVSPGTATEGLTAELMDLGKATKAECSALDLNGKIGLFAAMGTLEGASLSGQMEEAIRHGAAALVIYAAEDILNDETIRVQPPNIISDIPIVGICHRDAELLRNKVSAGNCVVTLKVDADFDPYGGTTYNVVGEIPGEISDERIVYTAHLDHYFRCLQDNMSTCSTLLGIAKAIIDSGYKPNRMITFAFHGSHETGGMDTRYPYIYGSYELTHESRKDWTGKTVANINFEYTALKMKKLQATAYIGVNRIPISYYTYSPEIVGGGFEEKEQYAPQTEYYMLSWSDSISYHTAGIPTLCNDPISEQYYEGTGPYVGRDHSNFDNWDIFDTKILEDVGRFYGGMGLYIDSMPYLQLDYTEQAARIKNEVDIDLLNTLGITHEEYFNAVERLNMAAIQLNKTTESHNRDYIKALSSGLTHAEKKAFFDAAHEQNQYTLKAYKAVADGLDKINSCDFLCLATVKYMQNTELLMAAKEALVKGDAKAAFELLVQLDLAAASYYFDEEVAEHMRKQICDPEFVDRRTWAAGRELNVFTYYELMQSFAAESETGDGFEKTLALADKAIETEAGFIPQAMDDEKACIEKVTELIRKALDE